MRLFLQFHQISVVVLCSVMLLSTLLLHLSSRNCVYPTKVQPVTSSIETVTKPTTKQTIEAMPPQETVAQNFCAKELCVLPFIPYSWTAMMNYAPQYGLANCAIPKSLSTISMAIFCYLYNETGFTFNKRNLPDENWHIRLCTNLNEVYTPDPGLLHAANWTHIAVVRHPIDRFLSGFVDKCVNEPVVQINDMVKSENWCFGCNGNISCFIYKMYDKLAVLQTNPPNIFIEDHFYPQSWFCNFREHINDYIILKYPSKQQKVKEFYDDLGKIFASRDVPAPMIQYIKDQLTKTKTDHATSGSKASKEFKALLFNNRQLLLTLLKMYYFDFVIFGYDFPQITK